MLLPGLAAVNLGDIAIAADIEDERAVRIFTLASLNVVADGLVRHPMFVGDSPELGSIRVGR
jgi:hypothetical protein